MAFGVEEPEGSAKLGYRWSCDKDPGLTWHKYKTELIGSLTLINAQTFLLTTDHHHVRSQALACNLQRNPQPYSQMYSQYCGPIQSRSPDCNWRRVSATHLLTIWFLRDYNERRGFFPARVMVSNLIFYAVHPCQVHILAYIPPGRIEQEDIADPGYRSIPLRTSRWHNRWTAWERGR